MSLKRHSNLVFYAKPSTCGNAPRHCLLWPWSSFAAFRTRFTKFRVLPCSGVSMRSDCCDMLLRALQMVMWTYWRCKLPLIMSSLLIISTFLVSPLCLTMYHSLLGYACSSPAQYVFEVHPAIKSFFRWDFGIQRLLIYFGCPRTLTRVRSISYISL